MRAAYRMKNRNNLAHVCYLVDNTLVRHLLFAAHLRFADFTIKIQLPAIFVGWIGLKGGEKKDSGDHRQQQLLKIRLLFLTLTGTSSSSRINSRVFSSFS